MFRRAATSAVVAIAAWLVFALFIGALAELAADRVAGVGDQGSQEQMVRNANLQLTIERFSPKTLYALKLDSDRKRQAYEHLEETMAARRQHMASLEEDSRIERGEVRGVARLRRGDNVRDLAAS